MIHAWEYLIGLWLWYFIPHPINDILWLKKCTVNLWHVPKMLTLSWLDIASVSRWSMRSAASDFSLRKMRWHILRRNIVLWRYFFLYIFLLLPTAAVILVSSALGLHCLVKPIISISRYKNDGKVEDGIPNLYANGSKETKVGDEYYLFQLISAVVYSV